MNGDIRWRGRYDDPGAVLHITKAIMDELGTWCNPWLHTPALVLVGEPRLMGDAIGPLLGDALHAARFPGPFMGTTAEPVLAHTWQEQSPILWVQCIRRYNRWPFIVAVDAAVGEPGVITVQEGPLKMGQGDPHISRTDPTWRTVGSLSILVDTHRRGESIRLVSRDLISSEVEVLREAITSAFEQWEDHVSKEYELAVGQGQGGGRRAETVAHLAAERG